MKRTQAWVLCMALLATAPPALATEGIFLSFSPTAQVQTPPQGQVNSGEIFQFYILGNFGAQASAWEAGVSVPSNITILNRDLTLPGSFNVSDDSLDDWIVGIQGCLETTGEVVVLATYDAELTDDVGQVDITLTASRFASAGAANTAWITCDGLAPQLTGCPTAGASITVNPSSTGARSGPVSRTRLLDSIPNPFNPSTVIRFQLARSGPAQLRIFNVAGKLVWEFDFGGIEAGVHEQHWDGTGRSGRRVASGAYFVRLDAGSAHSSLRIMLLK